MSTVILTKVINYVVTPIKRQLRARNTRPLRWDEYFHLTSAYVNGYATMTDAQRSAMHKRIMKLRGKVIPKDSVANA